MADTSIYYQKQGWSPFIWADEEEDVVEISLPPDRPTSSPTGTVGLGQVIRIMDEKRSRRLAENNDQTDRIRPAASVDETKEWTQIGYVVIIGLIIAILGTTLGFVFAGPAPFALAAVGMSFVIIALWQGGKLQKAQAS
jgi:hypothetical protein